MASECSISGATQTERSEVRTPVFHTLLTLATTWPKRPHLQGPGFVRGFAVVRLAG